jgi:hypothetical protein
MPGTTSPKAIPYPLPSEPPNGAAQMLALAEKVDDLLVAEESARVAADAAQDVKIADLYTKVPKAKVAWGRATVTTDSKGVGKITHNAGWAPSVVMLTAGFSGTAVKGVGLTVDNDVLTATQVGVMAFNLDTGAPYVGAINVHYILRD